MLDEEPEVMLEWGDQFVNAEILLPRGDKMARNRVICQKHDADGNLIGKFNMNPILDTCLYEVEFPVGGMTEIAAISLQSQCMPSVLSMRMKIYY